MRVPVYPLLLALFAALAWSAPAAAHPAGLRQARIERIEAWHRAHALHAQAHRRLVRLEVLLNARAARVHRLHASRAHAFPMQNGRAARHPRG